MAQGKSPLTGNPWATDPDSMKLDNPLLVGWEYASEERFAKRTALFHALLVGDNPDHVAYDTVPRRNRNACSTSVAVWARRPRGSRTSSARTSARSTCRRAWWSSLRARASTSRSVTFSSFPSRTEPFDCVFAGWMLYHVPDLDRAVSECCARAPARGNGSSHRVLRDEHGGGVGAHRGNRST